MAHIYRAASAAALIVLPVSAQATAIKFRIDSGDVVGRKSVGLLCFPSTPLRWDRAFRPDQDEVTEIIGAAFGDALAARVRGEVVKLKLKICQPHWGMLAKMVGDPTSLKGRIELEINWTVTSPACKLGSEGVPIRSDFLVLPDMKGGIAGVMRAALHANAQKAAQAFQANAGCPG